MQITSRSITEGQPIASEFALGQPEADTPMGFAPNRSPHLAWSGAPDDTRSFVLLCVDEDVPTDPSLVNSDNAVIPADHERCDFYHWVMINIPPGVTELAAGACSDGFTQGGKSDPPGPEGSRQGLNDYTGFFAGSDLAGMYQGYDGPCPPWNDERLHHYHFRIHALNVAELELAELFDGRAVAEAIDGHVLDVAELSGTYTLNPSMR